MESLTRSQTDIAVAVGPSAAGFGTQADKTEVASPIPHATLFKARLRLPGASVSRHEARCADQNAAREQDDRGAIEEIDVPAGHLRHKKQQKPGDQQNARGEQCHVQGD